MNLQRNVGLKLPSERKAPEKLSNTNLKIPFDVNVALLSFQFNWLRKASLHFSRNNVNSFPCSNTLENLRTSVPSGVYLRQQYQWRGFQKLFVISLTSKNVNLRAATDFQIDSTNPAIVVGNKLGWFQWGFSALFQAGNILANPRVDKKVKWHHSSPPEWKWIVIRTISRVYPASKN